MQWQMKAKAENRQSQQPKNLLQQVQLRTTWQKQFMPRKILPLLTMPENRGPALVLTFETFKHIVWDAFPSRSTIIEACRNTETLVKRNDLVTNTQFSLIIII